MRRRGRGREEHAASRERIDSCGSFEDWAQLVKQLEDEWAQMRRNELAHAQVRVDLAGEMVKREKAAAEKAMEEVKRRERENKDEKESSLREREESLRRREEELEKRMAAFLDAKGKIEHDVKVRKEQLELWEARLKAQQERVDEAQRKIGSDIRLLEAQRKVLVEAQVRQNRRFPIGGRDEV